MPPQLLQSKSWNLPVKLPTLKLDLTALPTDLPAFGASIGVAATATAPTFYRIQQETIFSLWQSLPLATKLVLLAVAILESPYPPAAVHSLLRDRELLPTQLQATILCETLYCTNCARLIPLPEPIESPTIGCVQCCAVCSGNFRQLSVPEVIATPIAETPSIRSNWLPSLLSNLSAEHQQAIYNSLQYNRVFLPTWKLEELTSSQLATSA